MVSIKEYESLIELFFDMQKSKNKEILPCDSPPYYQWIDDDENVYRIKITNLQKCFNECSKHLNDVEIQLLKDYFVKPGERTNNNTQQILKLPNLEKLFTMKIFW